MERQGESSKRFRADGKKEKEKEQQEKEQQRSCGVSQRKSKVRPFSQRGRTSAQERPAKPDTGAFAAATTNESSFTFSDGKSRKIRTVHISVHISLLFFGFYFNYCNSTFSVQFDEYFDNFLPHPLWIRSIPSSATKRQIQSQLRKNKMQILPGSLKSQAKKLKSSRLLPSTKILPARQNSGRMYSKVAASPVIQKM